MSRIDVFAHVLPPRFYGRMREVEPAIPQRYAFFNNPVLTDMELRRSHWDGQTRQVISHVNALPEDYVDPATAAELCAMGNDELLEMLRANRDMFEAAVLMVPMNNIDEAVRMVRERVTEETAGKAGNEKKALPTGEQAKICLHDKFWIIMMVFFFLYQFGGMVKNVSQNYFCTAMFKDATGNYTIAYGGQLQGTLAIIGAIPTAIGMVSALPLANKLGSKAKAILCGAVLATVGGIIGMLKPDNFTVVIISFVIKALGSTPAMYLSLALLADILDQQEAVHGARTDGLSMTIYGAIIAGMTGLTTGVLNAVLSAVNYDVSTLQTNTALRAAMPWVFIGGETLCYLGIFLMMTVEKFGKLDSKAIVSDQKAAAKAEGREYISAIDKIRLEEGEEAYQAELKKQADAAKAEEARIAKLTPEQKKAEKEAEAKLLDEFNALRKAAGKPALKA